MKKNKLYSSDMAGITLEQANELLQKWIDAEIALTTGESYSISVGGSTRSLTRVDLDKVRDSINYWSAMVNRLQCGTSRAPRVRLVIPHD